MKILSTLHRTTSILLGVLAGLAGIVALGYTLEGIDFLRFFKDNRLYERPHPSRFARRVRCNPLMRLQQHLRAAIQLHIAARGGDHRALSAGCGD